MHKVKNNAYSLIEYALFYFFVMRSFMEGNIKKQTVILENRKTLSIDCVLNVDSFNEDYLEISTEFGGIAVEGRELKIEELRQENGKILITGIISGVFYKETKASRGIFGGIFK